MALPDSDDEPDPMRADHDPGDLFVVSDLHLGRGKNPQTGRYYELECFFYDDDFRSFCRFLCQQAQVEGRPFTLILNGDTFDFLRLDKPRLSSSATLLERRFSSVLTPATCAQVVAEILEGHPAWVESIAWVIAQGHRVVCLPGNHDIEVQWPPVQAAIRDAIVDALPAEYRAGGRELVADNLGFRPWFYFEANRIWIEHGCQYDPENAFSHPLRRGLVDSADAVHQAEYDQPIGNVVQRYLYNAFGSITFIVPTTQAHVRYAKWLILNQPRRLARIVGSYWSFWWQVVRRLVRHVDTARGELERVHTSELDELVASSGLGDKLRQIDGLKRDGAGLAKTIETLVRQGAKVIGGALMTAALVFGLWFAGFHAISQLRGGFVLKALLFLMLDFGFLSVAIVGLGWLFLRSPRSRQRPQLEAAAKIAQLIDVPIVTFGHSHEEVLWRLGDDSSRRRFYFNTGTWLAVFTHDVLLPRERVQFSFLAVRGSDAELLHWSPGRDRPVPVVLIDEHAPWAESPRDVPVNRS